MASVQLKQFLLLFRRWPAILAAACVLAVDVLDSFGLDQAADEQAARIVGTVSAPFYGGEARIGQKALTVVLIDDASLEFMNWPTPLPYEAQADIVAALANFEPAAIFLDFSYLSPHGENPEQAVKVLRDRLLAQSTDGGPPVLIGEVGDHPALAPLRDIRSVGVAWREPSWLNYPLSDQTGRPMAAAALYDAWCVRNAEQCAPHWSPPLDQRLSLTWGFGGSPESAALNGRPANDECVLGDTGLVTRAGAALRRSFGSLARAFLYDPNRGDPSEARCIYSDTFNVATLLHGANDAAIEQMVRGRVVLVGAAHRQSADLQFIPHVGIVPGVFIHAMATDNLIEQGAAFHRPPPNVALALDLADLVEMLLSVGLYVMAWFMLRAIDSAVSREGEQQRARARRLTLFGAIALAIVFVGTAALIENGLHWPPLNILGVLVLVAVVFGYFERREKRLAPQLNET